MTRRKTVIKITGNSTAADCLGFSKNPESAVNKGKSKKAKLCKTKPKGRYSGTKKCCKHTVNTVNSVNVYREARMIYYELNPGEERHLYGEEYCKKFRASLHTLHQRQKRNVLFKTKMTKGKGGMIVWRKF